ncbi:MAG: hypothetical protein CL610_29030 [Anaerolineaceae bacterium]|nr:hypothetical protein [Anaerolineaceae bacterium]
MANTLRLISGTLTLDIELNDGPTAQAVWDALPIESRASTWGDEIYFSIPVKLEQEANARAEAAVGDVAYWAPGSAFCVFFGRTPASSDDTPVAASPVNHMGAVRGDATVLRAVRDGDPVRLERL